MKRDVAVHFALRNSHLNEVKMKTNLSFFFLSILSFSKESNVLIFSLEKVK